MNHWGVPAGVGVLCLWALAGWCQSLRLPSYISDHMVVQRDRPMAVRGWAAPGATVTIQCGSFRTQVVADAEGRWRAAGPSLHAGESAELLVTDGVATQRVMDIVGGEVWICSGQSNMAMPVRDSADAEVAASVQMPGLRAFATTAKPAATPQEDMPGSWSRAESSEVLNWYATAFYFGRKLHAELGVPVGLLMVAWGGTPVEAWIPRPVLEKLPVATNFLRESDTYAERYPKLMEDYEAKRARLLAQNKQEELRNLRRPHRPADNPTLAAVQFNNRIAPLVGVPVRGAIWYQGEANAGLPRAAHYGELLTALIRSWRDLWGEEFPFGIVQLPNFRAPQTEPVEEASGWAALREQQLRVVRSVAKTGLAVTIDVGQEDNIHPIRKTEVGERLAAWVLHDVYGRSEVVPCGPLYRRCERRDGTIVIEFDYAQGLHAKGDRVGSLAVCGADRVWKWAEGCIEQDRLIVWSAQVPEPVAVRYGWADHPPCNLYNAAGLPASPFRTDDFPLPESSSPRR